MIDLIIFSYNRAAQLDYLLRSINKHFTDIKKTISVLYNTSSSYYNDGYESLKEEYKDIVWYKEEERKRKINKYVLNCVNLYHFIRHAYLRNSKTNFKELLEIILKHSNYEFVSFFTDDGIFIKNFKQDLNIFNILFKDPFKFSFSLRLGGNSAHAPTKMEKHGDYYYWSYYKNDGRKHDWQYPFSVDGHIYSKEALLSTIKKIFYSNPNSFEEYVSSYVYRKKKWEIGICKSESIFVNIPMNIVQSTHKNLSLNLDANTINEYYLKGFKLYIDLPDKINTCKVKPIKVRMSKNTQQEEINLYEIR